MTYFMGQQATVNSLGLGKPLVVSVKGYLIRITNWVLSCCCVQKGWKWMENILLWLDLLFRIIIIKETFIKVLFPAHIALRPQKFLDISYNHYNDCKSYPWARYPVPFTTNWAHSQCFTALVWTTCLWGGM